MFASVGNHGGITVWKLKMVASVGNQKGIIKDLEGGASDVKLHRASGLWKKASEMTENKHKKSPPTQYIHSSFFTCMHKYIFTYMHTHTHIYASTYICIHIYVYIL